MGLSGCRFFWGSVCSVYGESCIFGGLFFGFVVVVVVGFVIFLFGIDIVGSGCVLVVFNGIVGFKLIKGMVFV